MADEDAPKIEPCRWCGIAHGPLCPYVKALEFKDEMGNPTRVTRVEFMTPNDIPPEIRKQQEVEAPSNYPKLDTMKDVHDQE